MKKLILIALLVWSGLANAAAPVASCSASRTTGIAPLYVAFDATATTDADTTTPFHDLQYTWYFGDDAAGTWAYGSNTSASKNSATGAIAGHVFETAGTFTVRGQASDGTTTSRCADITITVTSANDGFPTTNTLCVAATTTPVAGSDECPSGASVTMNPDFDAAISANIATKKRILFKRGDSFTSTGVSITIAGPGLIGAYGSGAKPVITASTDSAFIVMSSATTPTTVNDWRFMDLSMDGVSMGSSTFAFSYGGTFSQTTVLRVDMTRMQRGIRWEDSITQANNAGANNGHTIHSQNAVVDSTITNSTSYDIFAAGYYFAVMGNSTSGSPWGTRWPQLVKSIISHNTMSYTGTTTELIKLHAPTGCSKDTQESSRSYYISSCAHDADPFWPITSVWGEIWNDGVKTFGYSEQIIIADNKLTQVSSAPWIMTAGPQNGSNDERVRNLIFERNWIVTGTGANAAINIFMRNATVRNNICDTTVASNYPTCFSASNWGVEPPSDTVQFYNNTAYSGYAHSEMFMLRVTASATNVTAKNNLAYFPTGTTKAFIDPGFTPGTGYTATNNTTTVTTDPSFAGTTNPIDFCTTNTATPPATGGVTMFPASHYDFYNCKDKTGEFRLGACVPRASALCRGGK